MVLVQFKIVFHYLDWFGLVWRSVCKKGKCWVFKGNVVKILSRPLSLFWLSIKL